MPSTIIWLQITATSATQTPTSRRLEAPRTPYMELASMCRRACGSIGRGAEWLGPRGKASEMGWLWKFMTLNAESHIQMMSVWFLVSPSLELVILISRVVKLRGEWGIMTSHPRHKIASRSGTTTLKMIFQWHNLICKTIYSISQNGEGQGYRDQVGTLCWMPY